MMEINKQKATEFFRKIAETEDLDKAWAITKRGRSAIRPFVDRNCSSNEKRNCRICSIRVGRGFSKGELEKAKVSPVLLKKFKIPIDVRRKSAHGSNVVALNELSEILRGLQKITKGQKSYKKHKI